jgi:hypothetical protein
MYLSILVVFLWATQSFPMTIQWCVLVCLVVVCESLVKILTEKSSNPVLNIMLPCGKPPMLLDDDDDNNLPV